MYSVDVSYLEDSVPKEIAAQIVAPSEGDITLELISEELDIPAGDITGFVIDGQ